MTRHGSTGTTFQEKCKDCELILKKYPRDLVETSSNSSQSKDNQKRMTKKEKDEFEEFQEFRKWQKSRHRRSPDSEE